MALRRTLPPAPRDLRVLHDEDTLILSFELRGPQLTEAELDVMVGILAGRSNREIARHRGSSTRTVANQVASILKKLGVRSRLEIAALTPLSRG